MSSCYPVLLSPVVTDDNKCYIDGGILAIFPINYCMKKYPIHSEILAVGSKNENENKDDVTQTSSLFEFFMKIIYKMIVNLHYRINDMNNRVEIENHIKIFIPCITIQDLQQTITSKIARQELVSNGITNAKEFVENREMKTHDIDAGNNNSSTNAEDNTYPSSDGCIKKSASFCGIITRSIKLHTFFLKEQC